jgi:hypothetical protein
MTRTSLLVWVTGLAIGTCACATSPETQIVNDAAAALGGRDRVLAVKTLLIDGEGTNWNVGQDMTPEATSQAFIITGYRRAIDLTAGRGRIEQTRTPNFLYFQGQQPQKQVLGLDREIAYNVAPNGNVTRASDAVAKNRRIDLYHHPLTIVRAALNSMAKLSNARATGSQRVVDVTDANGTVFTLAIDATTRLPTRVVSMIDNPNLGDLALETAFADYQDVNGLKLPSRLTTMADRYRTEEIRITKQIVDADVGDLGAPPAAVLTPPITGPPPATVTVEEIAAGVWLLAGQSHHSVLVEFGDHLTLIEAPQSDTRTLAVIARARQIRPDKPLTVVVNTHHHFDHSGGIRAAVASDLAVITHKANGPFVQDLVGRAHTIAPDALAKNPKPLKFETVDDARELKDSTRTVVLYPITGSPHADTLLMAYFPKERILVEADVYSPGAAVHPFSANLVENIALFRSMAPSSRSANC